MRLLHVADTHLGFQAYRALDADGVNQRESDVYAAWTATVDHALERDVDLVVHAGDLFDAVRPTNRAIGRALDELLRLREAGIPVVVIAGNHETPRLKETGHVFSLLSYWDGIHPVHGGTAEVLDVAGITVHAVPHVRSQEDFEAALDGLEPTGGTDVLVLHGTVPGIEGLPTGEFDDLTVPRDAFERFDYVALGHYHLRTEVAGNAWYAGSTERLTFAEAGQDKGPLLVDPEGPEVEPLDVPARRMVAPDPVDCEDLSADEVEDAVGGLLRADLDGALVKVKLTGLPKDIYQAVDLQGLKRVAEGAVHVEIQPEVVRRTGAEDGTDAAIGSLPEEFVSFLQRVPVEDLDKRRLGSMARGYLKEARDAPP